MFKHLLSADEMKTSSLVISMLIVIITSVYIVVTKGDLPNNWLTLLMFLIGSVTGINVTNQLKPKNTEEKDKTI